MEDQIFKIYKHPWKKKIVTFIEWIKVNWVLVGFCFTLVGIFLAWAFYDVSFLLPLEEMEVRQKETRDKIEKKKRLKQMLARHLELGNTFLNNERYKEAAQEFNTDFHRCENCHNHPLNSIYKSTT